MMNERAKFLDCGSLLPLGQGSPAADERLSWSQSRGAPRGRSPHAVKDVHRPSRQQAGSDERQRAAAVRVGFTNLLWLILTRRSIASFALLLALSSVMQAADVFVSPSGNDATDGSLATPYLTIQKALSVAMPGDAVKLRAGALSNAKSGP